MNEKYLIVVTMLNQVKNLTASCAAGFMRFLRKIPGLARFVDEFRAALVVGLLVFVSFISFLLVVVIQQ